MRRTLLLAILSCFCARAQAGDSIVVSVKGPDGKPYPASMVWIWEVHSTFCDRMTKGARGRWFADDVPTGDKVNIDIGRSGKSKSAIKRRGLKRNALIEISLTADELRELEASLPKRFYPARIDCDCNCSPAGLPFPQQSYPIYPQPNDYWPGWGEPGIYTSPY
jgi:hypothetical protein